MLQTLTHYHRVWLLAVAVFYGVAIDSELVNTELVLPGEKAMGSSGKPWVTTFSTTGQYITLFYVGFC